MAFTLVCNVDSLIFQEVLSIVYCHIMMGAHMDISFTSQSHIDIVMSLEIKRVSYITNEVQYL